VTDGHHEPLAAADPGTAFPGLVMSRHSARPDGSREKNMKVVNIIGHEFDALPGHVTVNGRGSGSTLQSATCDALRELLKDQRLRRKHIGSFKLSVVVIADRKIGVDA
jgi:hypothetical protein